MPGMKSNAPPCFCRDGCEVYMKKLILIPDSFKGTLSAAEVCEILARTASRYFPEAEILRIPVADGGEGTADCFLTALGGEKIFLRVHGPWGEMRDAFFALLPDGTAVVETAVCAGLPLVGDRRDPAKTTTYGVGELLLAAAQRGAKRIVLGLGGSATNDAGCGAAAAAGIRFLDADGEPFVPVGETLCRVARIDRDGLHPALREIPLTVMCDVDSPLYGERGAAFVFAPQKGADEAMVRELDRQLRHIGTLYDRLCDRDISHLPGSGAAGGMGGGMTALLGGMLTSGIQTVLDTVHAKERFADADWIITGEGRLDAQSLRGKVISGVVSCAAGTPVLAIVGGYDRDLSEAYANGVSAVFSINTEPADFSVSRHVSRENLAATAENLFRLLRCAAGRGV